MARKRPSKGAQQDRDEGEQIPITSPLFDAIKKFVDEVGTQKAAADAFKTSGGTMTNVLSGQQKTLNRDLYVRVCKKLGFDTGRPADQLVALLGDLSPDDVAFLIETAKRIRNAG